MEEIKLPVFRFALRDDLKDDKRFLPTKAELYASGWDVRAAALNHEDIVLSPGQYFKIPLGFRSLCPAGWYYQLHPRSSTFTKKSMHNLIGIIDESWEGETLFAGQYIPDIRSLAKDLIIKFGDAIGQIIPVKKENIEVLEINNIDMDDSFNKRGFNRKSGGFGSTG